MKILLITGDHLRHLNFVDSLSSTKIEISWFIEKREIMIPKPPDSISLNLKKLYKLHFNKRFEAENIFFSKQAGSNAQKNINFIRKFDDINNITSIIIKKIKELRPKILLTYGCSIIPDKILNISNLKKLNIHLGLSPWYKGAATHFWPSYLLEPEYTGITVHELTSLVDAGPIIHQEIAELNKKDGIHENACRITKKFNETFPIKLERNINKIINNKGIIQTSSGRNFTTKLWKPDMLKMIYELFDDKINKYCIENRSLKNVKIKSIIN